jgi:cyclic pyranopterin phosphate synthase
VAVNSARRGTADAFAGALRSSLTQLELRSLTCSPAPWPAPSGATLRGSWSHPGYHGVMDAPKPFDGRPGPTDTLGRALRDLRISVTDRCNFRCTYCMPREVFGRDYAFLPRDEILTFEEITRLARVFVALGVEKLRITGGEPLVRRDLPNLIAMLADIRRPDGGRVDLTLTTNGSALRALAQPLVTAGLQRVTVSLDSLDDAVFGAMNGIDFPVARVLDGIDAAIEAGLAPVKVNMVVRRGVNEASVLPMATWARDAGVILRFIEYMDVGHSNGWRLDEVVPAADLIATIAAVWPIEPAEPSYRGEVAGRWRYQDGSGEFGVISSVTQPFCRDCTRARISAEGKLYTCLFAVDGRDLRALLRSGADDESVTAFIESTWRRRGDRYSELRSAATSTLPKIEMFAMGG